MGFRWKWEQVKRAMVENAREVCGSVRVGGKSPKNVRWNDVVKAAVEKKEAAARDKVAKDGCMGVYKEEKRKIKKCIYQSKREANGHFGRKMNQDVDEDKKLFWKKLSKVNRGKVKGAAE